MDRKEMSRGEIWEEEERKLRGQRAYKGAEKDLLVCQSLLDPTPSPGEKGEKGERRDIDLTLFMFSATGPGRRCFSLCLHNEEPL